MRLTRYLVVLLALSFAACGGGGNTTDGDDVPAPACSDGEDNDGDGMIDFPDDLGCISPSDESEDSPAMPQCSDGRDNDGDGKVDFPNDPGCSIPQQDGEEDDCPSGPNCPQCSNGKDDDVNGLMDYPNDPGCSSAADVNEFIDNPVACGPNLDIKMLPMDGMDSGTLDGSSVSTVASPCGGGLGASAVAYVVLLTEPKVVRVSTVAPTTTADTVIDIRSAQCSEPSSHLACNDDADANTMGSTVTRSLPTGTYYIIVEGHDTSSTGNYAVKVEMFAGEGAACTAPEQCGPGLVCRAPNGGGSGMICQPPMCNDAFDNDNDGKIDYPEEPGCTSPEDNDEADTCPGAGCPECSDGIDNDGDGKIDFGMNATNDATCKSAGDSSEACMTTETVDTLTQPQTMGTTVGAANDFNPTCASSSGSGPDRVYRLDLPDVQSISINLSNVSYDSVHTLLGSSCGGTALQCQDGTTMNGGSLAAGTYFLVVDGFFSTSAGSYRVDITGKVAPGGSCEGALFQSGALTCATGFTCDGTAGSKTCRTQCSDGLDNNGDGKIDFPDDPGCASPADNLEDTVCPGATCPVCSDGLDNEPDGTTDFPNDFGCTSAGGTSEAFCAVEPNFGGVITMPATLGDNTNTAGNYNQSCQASTGHDTAYSLQLPVPVVTLQIDTIGSTVSDTVVSLKDANCGVELGCDDDGDPASTLSLLVVSNVPKGNYAIQVDSFSTSNNGPFKLNVKGTVKAGTVCTSNLFTTGVLVCPTGTTCTAGICQ